MLKLNPEVFKAVTKLFFSIVRPWVIFWIFCQNFLLAQFLLGNSVDHTILSSNVRKASLRLPTYLGTISICILSSNVRNVSIDFFFFRMSRRPLRQATVGRALEHAQALTQSWSTRELSRVLSAAERRDWAAARVCARQQHSHSQCTVLRCADGWTNNNIKIVKEETKVKVIIKKLLMPNYSASNHHKHWVKIREFYDGGKIWSENVSKLWWTGGSF